MVLGSVHLFCSSHGILRQPLHLAGERETFWYLFFPCGSYGYRVRRRRKKERKKERKIFDFFSKLLFLASIKLS